MKILLSNASLLYKGGTEMYTLNLAKLLTEGGHHCVVFSPVLGEVANMIRDNGIIVTSDLVELEKYSFDILHIQHNINAWILRSIFPETPALMMVHGIIPEFEQPPKADLGISKYITVSNGVKEHLIKNHGIADSKIDIIHNWVDSSRFYQEGKINNKPKKLLVLSNHLRSDQEKIYREVCKEKGIEFLHIGLPNNSVRDVESYINKVDIVVTVGRGAIESMACGRNVIVSDINGIDGLITPRNYIELLKNNFSGHRYKRTLTKEIFRKELEGYSAEYSKSLIQLVSKYHDPQKNVEKILRIYKEIQKNEFKIDPCVNKSFFEIRMLVDEYSRKEIHIKYLNNMLEEKHIREKALEKQVSDLGRIIEDYKSTKLFKFGETYYKYRERISSRFRRIFT